MNTTEMSSTSSFLFIISLLGLLQGAICHGTLNVRDAEHMKQHLPRTIDLTKLSEREQLFHYFQINDIEGNNKLDGCELLQSLLHIHSEASSSYGAPQRIFSDAELSAMVDTVLKRDDKNLDGFVDYSEFLEGEINRGF